MPPVIAAVAAWAAAYAGVIAVVTVAISAGTAIYGAAQARKAERQARDAVRDSMKDRMVTRIATEAPHRYIYGRAKVGADIVAMFTTGDKDQYKHLVCVHAAHECEEIEQIWVNNALVDGLDDRGDPTTGRFAVEPDGEIIEEQKVGPTFTLTHSPRAGTVWVFSGSGAGMKRVNVSKVQGQTVTVDFSGPVTATYEKYIHRKFGDDTINTAVGQIPKNAAVRIQKHLGRPDDVADPYLRSVMGDKWPETAMLRGMCYTVITLDLNTPEFQGGLVPIHAVIRGRKLYDPRDGQTRWSANPALVAMDYLTSPLCGVPMADLPLAQFITAANVCDEAMPTGGARYTINGTVTSDQGQAGVLEAMAQAMAGGLVATTWDIYAGKYLAPVAALTQDDIVGSLSVNPGVSDASVYNGVKGQYIGPENKYVQTDFKPYQNAAYRESDGRDLYTNIDFPFTESLQRVTNLARIFTEDQRNGFTIKAEFSLKAWPLKVGQRIAFTSKFLGQTGKVYRITDKSYAPNSTVQLTLKEDSESIWDYADATVLDSTPNSDLPDPWRVDPLASISCTSGEATLLRQADGSTVPRIQATWPATMQQNGVQIEVEWRAVSSLTWERTTVSGSETQAYLSPITPGFFYVVRARAVNPSLNVRSNWVGTIYQVEVFTALPTVYRWSASKPAAPTGSATYVWSSGAFGSAPTGWSTSLPSAPAGGGSSAWAATVTLSDITDVSTVFDWAQADVSLREQSVAAALVAAQSAADTANAAIASIASDNVLSKGEKSQVIQDFSVMNAEFDGISAQAASLGVSTEAYYNSKVALNNYLATIPSWDNWSVDTAIVGTTFRTKFADYYAAKQALLNAMDAKSASVANSDNSIRTPIGAKYSTTTPSVAGALKIRLPQSYTGTMLRFTVDIFEFAAGYSCTLEIAGYTFTGTPAWLNVTARVIGSSNVEYPVYFGHDGTRCCVWIGNPGDSWDYPQVQVRDFFAGYTNTTRAQWESGWSVSFDTAAATNVTASVLDTYPAADWRKTVGAGRPQDGATVGAPPGTNVGNTPATVVEANANGAVKPPTFTLTGTFGGVVTDPRTTLITLSKVLSATVSNNVNPVTIVWDAVNTDSTLIFRMSNNIGPNATVSATAANNAITIAIKCTATDDVTGVSVSRTGLVILRMGAY